MTLQQYYDALMAHDWWYEMSDDNAKFARGEKEHSRLVRAYQKNGAEWKRLWQQVKICRQYGDGEFGKPERPDA